MKNTTKYFKNHIQNNYKWCFILALTFVSTFSFGQTITPIKTVTNSTTNCGIIDVRLDITGSNPEKRNADVILVIDVSGSMNNQIDGDAKKSMQYAKDAAKAFITTASANADNRVSIVSYSTTAKLEIGLTYLNAAGLALLTNEI